jgi:hypothetical protein
VVPDNADANLAASIARDAGDPGAGNVIGSGQKLPPQVVGRRRWQGKCDYTSVFLLLCAMGGLYSPSCVVALFTSNQQQRQQIKSTTAFFE